MKKSMKAIKPWFGITTVVEVFGSSVKVADPVVVVEVVLVEVVSVLGVLAVVVAIVVDVAVVVVVVVVACGQL